jgi:predicted nucleotidyltransferase
MTRDEIIARLRGSVPALKAEGVTGLAIFGSRARGDAREDSDLDVLVDIDPDSSFSLLNLAGVQHIIRDATGIETQATLRSELDDRQAERVADDLVKVF